MPGKAILIDITKCVGCRTCEATCKQVHGLPEGPAPVLSETAFKIVEERAEGKFVPRQCLHCESPACASACPVGALKKTALGPVVYDADKCIGCRYCMIACAYGVPKYQWTKLKPFVVKCDMCYDRLVAGGKPACVEACPVQAAIFGDREEILREAHRRIINESGYVPHIYGASELGGTSVFYISDVPFERLGFITTPTSEPLPTLTAAALGEVPTVVMVGGSLLAGLYWITQRRREVAQAETRHKEERN